ncbi:triacylglycerol lipase [Kitasatospora aureofaciens]|uniref:esterase/lipase family protein n=1 Tax=Kitasatospora aureofaciens TaxID=1894 RepID=UPI001C494BA1|nr:alpha/beta hydrolase [Kitasatospora aureofaciens]MBV6702612.1 alpha/beta hydrolase [Kitasatospora aureofaciens]
MRQSVLFVHGTGVREESYNESFALVRSELGRLRPGIEVRGCFWGREHGASLALDGVSIPRYAQSKGGIAEDDDIAVWGVLYYDPWYELRALGLRIPEPAGMTRGLTPSQRFLEQVTGYTPTAGTAAVFARHGLAEDLTEALRTVLPATEVREAAATVDEGGYEHRHAVARALVAAALASADARGAQLVSGGIRDALLAAVGSDLYTEGRSIKSKIGKVLATPALLGFSRRSRQRRGAWSDGALPALGDILRYQARGQGVRDYIRRAIENTPGDSVTVIAHSLGGVACVDLLVREKPERVDRLITVGSQAPFFYEIGALVSLEHPEALPPQFPARWLNLYDQRDLLGYRASEVFPGRAYDQEVNNGQPFPWAHTSYWSNPQVWEAVGTWLD